MRTKNSIKNIYMSLVTQIVIVALGFISRKVFIDSLGTEYLGINGLLTNIISMLSLAEAGIGTSIVYKLYKPLAERDESKIIVLIQLYKKLYSIIAIIVFLLSLTIYPFIDKLIKDGESIPFISISIIYFIFVFKNVISYLNAHKWSLINADQKGYILAKYNLIFNVITTISKIIILLITKNYILFLLIELVIFIVQNIWNGKVVNKRYPYIKTKKKYSVEKEVKKELVCNTKALFLHSIGRYCVFGTDNILISVFINIRAVGLYSNYTMIISQLNSLLNSVIWNIGASVGNLIAIESKEKSYEIFNVVHLVNFWIYSFGTIFLFNLTEPFINWWLGEGLLLDRFTFIFVLINFYLTGMRASILTFKGQAGIFTQDKYGPLIEAIVNLLTSIILVEYLGLAGIFMGTAISTILVPFWIQSKLVYNKIFNKSVVEYFRKYIFYAIVTLFAGFITTFLCNVLVVGNSFISLVLKGIICILAVNILYLLIFFKTYEFKYIWKIISSTISKFKYKLKIIKGKS